MNRRDFNILDIEILCRLYREGKLDAEEERLLAVILPSCGFESDIIDETIFLMGLEKIAGKQHMANVNSSTPSELKRIHGQAKTPLLINVLKRIVATSVAAAALISIVSFGWDQITGRATTPVCEVYVEGIKVADDDPRLALALNDYHKNMEMIAEMRRMEKEKLGEARKMIRETRELEHKYQRMSNLN